MISLPEINQLLIHDDDQRKNVSMSLDKAAENAELHLLPIRNFLRFSMRTIVCELRRKRRSRRKQVPTMIATGILRNK